MRGRGPINNQEEIMPNDPEKAVRLQLENDLELLPTLQGFIENSAKVFGLDEAGALSLTLAGEEVFNYLCGAVGERCGVDTVCRARPGGTELEFTLPLPPGVLKNFNLTAVVNPDDEESLEEMGLLIASRMIDRLKLEHRPGGGLRLTLGKDKSYPEYKPDSGDTTAPVLEGRTEIAVPDGEELKHFLRTLLNDRPAVPLPAEFSYPGRLADLLKGGELEARILRDRAGRIGGGLVWHWLSPRIVESRGPFLTLDETDRRRRRELADALFEECVKSIAKSPAVGIVSRFPGLDLSLNHLENLGETGNGPLLFRQMQEDPGAVAWHPPELEDFLRQQYRRLLLPRELRGLRDDGEEQDEFSVLACEFERNQGRVEMYPLLPGCDLAENLKAHLELFRDEDLGEIVFRLDLGRAAEAGCIPALLETGFIPDLILPHGGERGDLLFFRFPGEKV
jgi:hypothetical protein